MHIRSLHVDLHHAGLHHRRYRSYSESSFSTVHARMPTARVVATCLQLARHTSSSISTGSTQTCGRLLPTSPWRGLVQGCEIEHRPYQY